MSDVGYDVAEGLGTQADAPRRAGRRLGWLVGVPLVYLGCSFVLFQHFFSNPGQTVYGSSDSAFFAWWLRWVPYAISHGLNPFYTHYLNSPDGVSMMWNTTVPLLGLVLAPVTLLVGPLTTVTLLELLAPALSAATAFWVLRRWVRRPAAAAVGGLLYGFSPFFIGHSYGHLSLTFAVTPPLLLLLGDELLIRQRWSVRRVGVILGLVAAAQVLIGEEMLVLAGVGAVVGILILALLRRDQVRARARYAATGLAVAAGVAAVILAVPLYYQLFGPGRLQGMIQAPDKSRGDLAAFVMPPHLVALATASTIRRTEHFAANGAEDTVYLGLPLLVLLVFIAARYWRLLLVRWAALVGAAVAVLSLGSRLTVDAHSTPVPLPWVLFEHIPVLNDALPIRLSVIVALLAGLLVACWLDAVPLTGPQALGAGAAAAVALVPLVPAAPLQSGRYPVPSFFSSGEAGRVLPHDGTVVLLPYPWFRDASGMVWQAAAGLPFRMAGGYFLAPGPGGRPRYGTDPGPLVIDAEAVAHAGDRARLPFPVAAAEEDADRLQVTGVVVGPMLRANQVAAFACKVLGGAATPDRGVWYCAVRPDSA